MIVRVKEDVAALDTVEVKCKFCFSFQDFKKDWKMWAKQTMRKGEMGILETWSFHCPRCQAHLNVQHWHRTPSEPMFSDEFGVENATH